MNSEDKSPGGGAKNVAIVGSPNLEFYGGTQVNVIQSAEILSALGFKITIFGSGTYFERRNVDLGEKIGYVKNAFPFDPFSWKIVQKVSRGVSEPLIGMFTSGKIMKIVGNHDSYYFTAPKFIFRSISGRIDSSKRVLLANHGTYLEFLSSRRGLLSSALINLFDSIFLKYANSENTFIHTQNTFQREHYLKRGIPGERIFLIPQCDVDFSRYSVRNNDEFRVLFLNRLSKDKGAHLIPNITNECKDVEFVVIGDGPLMYRLREECGQNVRFTGFLSEKDKEDEVGKCDVILNLSSYESLSISSIEGIASGLTVVSKNETSGLSFIREKVPGAVLFGDKTVDSMSSIIRKIKKEKENDRRQFLENKLRIRSNGEPVFDKSVVTNEMVELFRFAISANIKTV